MTLDLGAIERRVARRYMSGGIDADGAAYAASEWSKAVDDVSDLLAAVKRLRERNQYLEAVLKKEGYEW